MLIDSHCHLDQLDLKDFDDNLEKALDLAKQNGVTHMLNVCIDLNNFPNVLHIAKQHSNIYASVGVHPNEFDLEEPTVEELIKLGQDEKIIAIGETGLDYYRTEEDKIKRQKQRFSNHIQVAKTLQKPLIIHTRQARVDTLDILRVEKADEIAGVMHCFTEDWLTAKQAMDLNFYISISGIITFKNAQELRDVVKMLPLDRILIETDAPYLAPVPYRGKPNQPAYVKYVAETIAEIKNISYDEVAKATSDNFMQLFF